MELKDRILKVMANENLSASVFADRIGVQRSSISHILSGRNKPSLEFLQKIISSFPNYSVEWLIMDTGDMRKAPANTHNIPKQAVSTNLFETTANKETPKKNNIPNSADLPKEITKSATQSPVIPDTSTTIDKSKTVERIVVFYTDKTFDSYSPK